MNKQPISKEDLEKILQVNSKAIELEMEVAKQNQEIIDSLELTTGAHQTLMTEQGKLILNIESIRENLRRNHEESIRILNEKEKEILRSAFENKEVVIALNQKVDGLAKDIANVKSTQERLILYLSGGIVALLIELIKLVWSFKK